jgi:hypothetical protein
VTNDNIRNVRKRKMTLSESLNATENKLSSDNDDIPDAVQFSATWSRRPIGPRITTFFVHSNLYVKT